MKSALADDGNALRRLMRSGWVQLDLAAPAALIDEFWVPPGGQRADLVALGDELWAFEIKSQRDDLRRLPAQIAAFSRVFDRCVAVVAPVLLRRAADAIPDWWGLVSADPAGGFSWMRSPEPNGSLEPEVLVRLLWRDEAAGVLERVGISVPRHARRHAIWRRVLSELPADQVAAAVRLALIERAKPTAAA